MREAWAGDLIKQMYLRRVTRSELAKELGVTKSWVSQVLSGTRKAKGAETRFCAALDVIIARKEAL